MSGGCTPSVENHNIILQLADHNGYLVDGTTFTVTLRLTKIKEVVTINLPTINFQTGQISDNNGTGTEYLPGGYLKTIDGYLPREFRPANPERLNFLVASNNNWVVPWDPNIPPSELEKPVSVYKLEVTSSGAVNISASGTFQDIIPPGNQIVQSTSITYLTGKNKKLCGNFTISEGPSDLAGFYPGARDSHVNDAYGDIVAYAWIGNYTATSKAGSDCLVKVGHYNRTLPPKFYQTANLTNYAEVSVGYAPFVFDTSVAINRKDPNNIVAAYGVINTFLLSAYIEVSTPLEIAEIYLANSSLNLPFTDAFHIDPTHSLQLVTNPGVIQAPGSLTDKLALIPSDGILDADVYIEWASNMEEGGAIGVIIYNTQNNAAAPGADGDYPLPTLFIGADVGNLLVANLNEVKAGISSLDLEFSYLASAAPYISISNNGGKDWAMGKLALKLKDIDNGAGDCGGVTADIHGNIWYNIVAIKVIDFDNGISTWSVKLFISSDKGESFDLVYTTPFPLEGFMRYDYAQTCFGYNENHQYGLWCTAVLVNEETAVVYNTVIFIPINGLGKDNLGVPQFALLEQFNGNIPTALIAADSDGRVWIAGVQNGVVQAQDMVTPVNLVFKSPGAIDENYAGPWNIVTTQNIGLIIDESGLISQPYSGFFNCPTSLLYDLDRKALYFLIAYPLKDYIGQDMNIYLMISRDNGQTWPYTVAINDNSSGNRGFQSMALNDRGDLVIGWYDGRNDPTYKNLEYYGAIIPARKLEKVVNSLPLSNPLYNIPPPVTPSHVTPQPIVKNRLLAPPSGRPEITSSRGIQRNKVNLKRDLLSRLHHRLRK